MAIVDISGTLLPHWEFLNTVGGANIDRTKVPRALLYYSSVTGVAAKGVNDESIFQANATLPAEFVYQHRKTTLYWVFEDQALPPACSGTAVIQFVDTVPSLPYVAGLDVTVLPIPGQTAFPVRDSTSTAAPGWAVAYSSTHQMPGLLHSGARAATFNIAVGNADPLTTPASLIYTQTLFNVYDIEQARNFLMNVTESTVP